MFTEAEKVRHAARHIEEFGLHKLDYSPDGSLYNIRTEGRPCCTMGAFTAYDVSPDTEQKFRDRLEQRVGSEFIGDWNDAPERTREEVVQTLREFADDLEKENADA